MALLKLRCEKCGHVFEELVFGGNLSKVKCEKCGAGELVRHYQGKCYFGAAGSSAGSGGCSGHCAGCSGCSGH